MAKKFDWQAWRTKPGVQPLPQDILALLDSRDAAVKAIEAALNGRSPVLDSERAAPSVSESQPELLPCPFCGTDAEFIGPDAEQKREYGNDQVYCPNCYASTVPDLGVDAAAAWWNARADSNQETIKALREALAVAKGMIRFNVADMYVSDEAWQRFQDNSPKMRQINAALALVTI